MEKICKNRCRAEGYAPKPCWPPAAGDLLLDFRVFTHPYSLLILSACDNEIWN